MSVDGSVRNDLARSATRQGAQAAQACTVDIHRQDKVASIIELALGNAGCRRERDVAIGERRGLKEDDLTQAGALTQLTSLPDDGLGKGGVQEPAANEGVGPGDVQNGVQRGLLEHRGGQDRQIQAVTEALLENILGEADLLADVLVTRSDRRVSDAARLQRAVDRRDRRADPVGVLALVANQRRNTGMRLEDLPRLAQDGVDAGGVGGDEGS